MRMRVARLPNLDAVARAAVDGAARGMKRGLLAIQGEAQRIVHEERYATGHLAQAFHTALLPPENGRLVGTLANVAPYAPFVEYDTRPHVAPIEPFLRWATTKGFRATGRSFWAGSSSQRRLGIIGWLAVKRRGTKGIRFMKRAYDAKHGEARDQIFAAIREALRRYAAP